VEATSDQTLAANLCHEILEVNAAPNLNYQAPELAKLFLIARIPLPEILGSKGWSLFTIRDAEWQEFESHGGSVEPKTGVTSHNASGADYVPMPAPSFAVLQNVTLTSGDVLTSDESLLRIDPAANPAFSFVAGHQGVVVGTHSHLGVAAVLLPEHTGQFVPEGILLSSRADANWFHWLIETLPKLLYLESEVAEDVPIIISAHIPRTAKESLRFLTDRKTIEVDPSAATRVGKLFVASPVLFHPDPAELYLKPVSNTVNLEAVARLRKVILSKAALSITDAPKRVNIFVSRSAGARSLVNSKQVAKYAQKLGFSLLDPGYMSFLDQVVAFHAAKRVILVGGASFANLVFCSDGSKVWVLSSTITEGYAMPKILALLSGSRVLSVGGRPLGTAIRYSKLEKLHSHYVISTKKLRSQLDT
jgi:hypothetical protein